MKYSTAYLHFNGNCRTIMKFYRDCFGAELQLMPHADESGAPSADPAAPVMHSQLNVNGAPILMASDGPPGEAAGTIGDNFSVAIECSSAEELSALFGKLSKDGKVSMLPSDLPWGRFAMCVDVYGTSWILNCAKD